MGRKDRERKVTGLEGSIIKIFKIHCSTCPTSEIQNDGTSVGFASYLQRKGWITKSEDILCPNCVKGK